MARVSVDKSSQTYEPPRLPEYLRNVFDLKPVVGVPSDEEVIGIHAVIRAAYNVSHVPGMFDPALSMNLSQHLFELQMARYREKYPIGMFSGDTMYTPPELPSHFPTNLQSVLGAPSDEELQNVQAAVRAYEHFVHIPSMFDPHVSMGLSQHLCNLQIARYMQHVALGQSVVQHKQPCPRNEESTEPSGFTDRVREPLESARDILDAETPATPAAVTRGADSQQPPSQASGTITENSTYLAQVNDSNILLEEIRDTMQNVNRVLISTQRIFARGARGSHNKEGYVGAVGQYEMINEKGERPKDNGLPQVTRRGDHSWYLGNVNDEQLARYLLFYGIGSELVQSGDVPVLKEGKRSDAEAALLKYLE